MTKSSPLNQQQVLASQATDIVLAQARAGVDLALSTTSKATAGLFDQIQSLSQVSNPKAGQKSFEQGAKTFHAQAIEAFEAAQGLFASNLKAGEELVRLGQGYVEASFAAFNPQR